MSRFSNKFIGLSARLLCKAYEVLLTIYTALRRGLEQDPSKVLVDLYSNDQARLQADLDVAMAGPESVDGELLVIIPFRDRWDLTASCLESLANQVIPSHLSLKVILVDNRSIEPETAVAMSFAKNKYPSLGIETLRADYSFNFSKLNNDGFRSFKTTKTKWVLFLNNDVKVIEKDLLARMSSCLQSVQSIGVVGCTLLYPTGSIQHLFATPGCKIIAAHPLKGVPGNQPLKWFEAPVRPVPAVTGALLMMRVVDFDAVGGFDESLPTLGQDIGLCLNVARKFGKYSATITKPSAIHHESMTKAPSFPEHEVRFFYDKYGDVLKSQPIYSPRLSRWSEKPLLALPFEPKYPVLSVIRYWQ